MAEEKMEKQPAPTTTPDAVPPSPPVEKKKLQPRAAPPPFPPVPDVILWWVLCNAGSVCFSFVFSPAYVFIANTICNNPPSSSCLLLPHVELTDWELAVVRALLVGSLWCSTPQAAAGVLALALPCHRRRARVLLTYAALAPTVASHCMLAGALCVFVAADPSGLFFWIFGTASILMFAVADLLCFVVLLGLRGEEEQ